MKIKKILSLILLLFFVTCSIACAKNYESEKYYKLTERNSRGQKVGTTRVYYRGEKSNVTRVSEYNTKGKRTHDYRR